MVWRLSHGSERHVEVHVAISAIIFALVAIGHVVRLV